MIRPFFTLGQAGSQLQERVKIATPSLHNKGGKLLFSRHRPSPFASSFRSPVVVLYSFAAGTKRELASRLRCSKTEVNRFFFRQIVDCVIAGMVGSRHHK